MKPLKCLTYFCSLLLLIAFFSGCIFSGSTKNKKKPEELQSTSNSSETENKSVDVQSSLPVKYQTASYVVDDQSKPGISDSNEPVLRVGARITSTTEPQPLWSILKKLAALKRMNVSWESDVNKDVLVDVDINAKDDFFSSVNNLLAQAAYFAEFKDSTIFVRNKTTKQYRISMPFITHEYTTDTGGDIIGGDAKGYKALINIKTTGSPVGTTALTDSGARKAGFDIWANIEANLKVILDILETSETSTSDMERKYGESGTQNSRGESSGSINANQADGASDTIIKISGKGAKNVTAKATKKGEAETKAQSQRVKSSRQVAKDGSYFIIDKPVGIITVTTTRANHERIGNYITSLTKEIYKQIAIEAKIIEVKLTDASSIGINWNSVLKNFALSGVVEFGAGGQVYPFVYSNDAVQGKVTYTDDTLASYTKTNNPGQFISKISMATKGFDVFLNALNEQGATKVLSNPKISVLNGQPAFITVGRNVTYIDAIDSKVDDTTGVITYTVKTERILSGIGMALTATVLGENEIVMNLVPITSQLQEPIAYKDIGNLGATVGLPIVNVREMSTTVRVKDGEMLVIGGLIDDVDKTEGSFAPLLGDIPYLRYLFGFEEKLHEKKELIILLKPRIF